MKIKIELNSKELHILNSDTKDLIQFDFEADVVTESGNLSTKEENLVFGSALWALLTMLPHGLIKHYFKAWNTKVEKLHKQWETKVNAKLKEEGFPLPKGE